MKWLMRGALALLLLGAFALGALAVLLPRIAGSAAVRARIEAAARDAIGREVRFGSIEAGLLPPSLRVAAPRIAGATPKAPPLLEAKSVSLRLALLPLLARRVAIDSLLVDGATLRLTRTKQGLDLPTPGRDGSGSRPERGAGGGESSGVALALRRVALRDATLVLVDRGVDPAVTWELRKLRADATGRLLGERVDLEASAELASGGSLRAQGNASLAGDLDLSLELTRVALAPFAPYLPDIDRLAGEASGSARVAGRAADPERVSGALDFDALELRRGALRAAGQARAGAELASPLRAPSGSFRADARGADLSYGEAFRKPAGVAAELSGRLAPAKGGGLAIEDLALELRDLALRGRVARLAPLELELRSEKFELAGAEQLVPALAAFAPSGRARVESLAFAAQPRSLRGRVELDGVEAHPAGRAPLALRGALLAEGQSLRLEQGRLVTGGQDLALDAVLEDLFGAPRYRMALEARGADANQVVGALAGRPDTLFGVLGLEATFSGPLGGDLLHRLQGRAGFGVDQGRLAGVSLLREVFERFGTAGSLALDLGRVYGGRDLQRFYGDTFETLRGNFDVKGGVAHTDDLTFVYRGYGAVLRGTMGLVDLALDTQGELTFQEELDGLIARELGLRNYTPVRRSISLAAVTGTLVDPKVRLSSRSVADLASAYATPLYVDPLRRKAEKALGKDGGAAVDQGLQILDGLLGGRRRERAREEPASGRAEPQQPAAEAPSGTSAPAGEAPAPGASTAPAKEAAPAPGQ